MKKEPEQIKQEMDSRQRSQDQELSERKQQLAILFAPGRIHGWQITEEASCPTN